MLTRILRIRFLNLSCLALALSFPVLCLSATIEPFRTEHKTLFTHLDLNDDVHSLTDYKGKIVLVNFWASWCPPCIHEMPALKKLKQRYQQQPFEILTLNVGEKKYKVRKFAKLIKLNLPVLLDTTSETFNRWDVKTLPTSFLIDVNGDIRYRVFGNPGWDSHEAIAIIEQMLTAANKPKETSR